MNYLFNDRNLVRSAVLSALNVNPSSVIYRTDTAAKQGGGTVNVSGPYAGAHDTAIDVEILDTSGDSSQVSEPVFSGIGNGTMTDVAASGLDPQDITVTLVNLGTPTLIAHAQFQGTNLIALAGGEDGNSVIITVDDNSIVREDSNFSLLHDISAGTNQFTGAEWDFGALELQTVNGQRQLNPATPRICFGDDPQVYRPYKDYVQGQYVYSFSPPPLRDVPAGTIVKNVSGTYSLHVTDGTTIEDYTGIVTLFDALNDLNTSALVKPDPLTAVVVNDLTPNGMGINDLSVSTDSQVLSVTGTGSQYVTRTLLEVAVQSSAPTEILRVICTDATHVGSELWGVSGDVSGDLGTAISGEAFAAGSYGFTIPQRIPTGVHPGGNVTLTTQLQPRGDSEQKPVACLEQGVLGAQATNRSFTFVYKKRPPAACDCETGALVGGPSADCLGIQPEGGGVVSASNKRLVRLQLLTAAVTEIVRANTAPIANTDIGDVSYMQIAGTKLKQGLDDISNASTTFPAWTAGHLYVVDDIIAPGDGYRYRCTTGGTSHTTAPTFVHTTPYTSTTTETTGVVWTVMEKDAWGVWDDALAGFKTDVSALATIATGHSVQITDGTAYVTGDIVYAPGMPTGATVGTDPVDRMTFFYQCTSGGSAGSHTDANYSLFTSGVAVIEDYGTTDWECIGVMQSGLLIRPGDINANASFTGYTIDDYLEARYGSLMDNARAAAGLDPSFKQASINGDDCWHDHPELGFYFESQDGLLPMFVGYGYHSAKLVLDENGHPFAQSTQEFYVGIKWGCPDKIKVDDQITITLDGVSGGPVTYQLSDEWDVSVAHADPLQLGGGQDGDDTLTWSVLSSDGTFAPYALITTAPAPYSDGGLGFQITPGLIAFALGDAFRFSIEGGHFRWRRDGGSWTTTTIGSGIDAGDGLDINLVGGAAPSWVAGDAWSFAAEATNGPDRAKSPTDGRFAWTGSTTLTIAPSTPGPATTLAICDHHIPSDAAIRLQGTDDNFATTPTDIAITWAAGNILATFASVTRAKWRITVDKSGDMFWPFLGVPMQPTLRDPSSGDLKPDYGHFTRRRRFAGIGVRAGIGGEISHDVVCAESLEDFEAGLDFASANDDSSFGLVTNTAAGELSLVRFNVVEYDVKDQLFDYQASVLDRYQSFTLPVEPLS
jgi:hypothetical protein